MTTQKFPNELNTIMNMFRQGKTSKDVKQYLIDKYNCTSGSCTAIVRCARKRLGILHVGIS